MVGFSFFHSHPNLFLFGALSTLVIIGWLLTTIIFVIARGFKKTLRLKIGFISIVSLTIITSGVFFMPEEMCRQITIAILGESLPLTEDYTTRDASTGNLSKVQSRLAKIESGPFKENLLNKVLSRAVANGHINIVEYAVSNGANVNYHDEDFGETPLMYAAVSGQTDIVKYLVKNGALLDDTDSLGKTALFGVVGYGKYETAELLIDLGANVWIRDNRGTTIFDVEPYFGATAETTERIRKIKGKIKEKLNIP